MPYFDEVKVSCLLSKRLEESDSLYYPLKYRILATWRFADTQLYLSQKIWTEPITSNRNVKQYQHQLNAIRKIEMLLKSWLGLKTRPGQFALMQMAFVQQWNQRSSYP